MQKYPTKKEILTYKPDFKGEVKILKTWKKSFYKNWNKKNNQEKLGNLTNLINFLANLHKTKVQIKTIEGTDSSCYNPRLKTIFIDNSLSIITTLHEFGHHLFGPDETQACRWSIHLFKKVFPKTFEKLRWEGHMLKQINEASSSKKDDKTSRKEKSMNNEKQTLREQVQTFREKARKILRMKLVNEWLQDLFRLNASKESEAKAIERHTKTVATEEYNLNQLDENHPDHEDRLKRAERDVECAKENLASTEINAEKTLKTIDKQIEKAEKAIEKIEAGETKVSIEEVEELTRKMISNLATS